VDTAAALSVFTSVAELEAAIGRPLGVSRWLTVDQERIDGFATVTGDHQWVHVDADRASAGPFGTTIAHGWLTLSLLPALAAEVYGIDGASMAVNYGADRVRFLSPVLVGSRVRAAAELVDVVRTDGGCRTVFRLTGELEGGRRPACVADIVTVWHGVA
jgi:acyl dehydratase